MQGTAKKKLFYDEVFLSGKPRSTYRRFFSRLSKQPASKIARVKRAAKQAFQGDAEVLTIPMIFSQSDYELLAQGTLQRGRAIHSFLYDHYFGARKYLQYPLMRSLPLSDIIKRNHENITSQLLRPETRQFWYAPDVIRDPEGQFRVIEDNTGFVGGFGDLEASNQAARILRAGSRRLKGRSVFYRQLIDYYRSQAQLHGGGKTVLLSYDPKIRVTHEDQRLAAIFTALGVEHVTELDRLELQPHGLYHRGERVSFVILNRETSDIESGIESGGSGRGLRGFWASAQGGHFGVSYVPGVEFVNDKEFYQCVELLIHIYLKETPILKNIKTISLRKKTDIGRIFSKIDKWVIKTANGRGGEEVWIGKKLGTQELQKLKKHILKNRSRYVAQEYVELSRIKNHSVDMRSLSMIAADCQIVSPTPWGRAIPVSATGKVNISGGGLVAIAQVLSEDDSWI